MSEKTKKTVCPQCGAEVDVNEKKDFKKILDTVRGLLEDEEVDSIETLEQDAMADAPLASSPDASVSVAKPSLREQIKNVFGNRLINRLVVFLLAVCMLALSFAPFVRYEVATSDDVVYRMSYSGADNVQISLYSMFMGGPAKLDTSTYEQALRQMTDPEDKVTLLKQMMTVASVYSQKGTHITSMLASLLFVVYVLFCVIFVVVAGVNLAVEFFTAKKNRRRIKKCASDGLLCFLLCLLPALCFLMLQSCELCTGVGVLSFVTPMGARLSWGAIISLVLAILGGIFVCASHSLGVLRVNRRYFDRARIKHMLTIVLIVLVLLSTLMPCLQVQMIDVSRGKELSLGMNFWEIREMTSNEWMAIRKAPTKVNQEYITTLVATSELSEHAGKTFCNTLLITSDAMMIYTLYVFVEIVSLLTLFFGGMWLFAVMRRGFFGKKRLRMLNLFKVLTMICVCLNFIFTLIIKNALDACLRGNLLYMVRFGIGKGMILMFVCALLAVILRLREKRAVQYVDEEYDNADVSYAPYVRSAKR